MSAHPGQYGMSNAKTAPRPYRLSLECNTGWEQHEILFAIANKHLNQSPTHHALRAALSATMVEFQQCSTISDARTRSDKIARHGLRLVKVLKRLRRKARVSGDEVDLMMLKADVQHVRAIARKWVGLVV